MTDKDDIHRITTRLHEADHILFITGAGISADSGLPTYRGIGGLYNNNEELEEGIPIETALSGGIWKTRPEITWKYIYQMEEKCRSASFNRAHRVIVEMENHFKRVWTLTQNVDGFHRAAGSQKVIDIHGDIHQLICTGCSWRERVNDFAALSIPPRCPGCRGMVRPDVVLFGERLPPAKVETLTRELDRGFDLYFSIGTSSVFPYIMQPMIAARLAGKTTIEINPGSSEISHLVDFKISAGAAETLNTIWTRYRERFIQ